MSETAEPDHVPGYVRFDCTSPDAPELTAAADAARQAIEQGECIVLPTDTVYGIGADAFSAAAVQRLLGAKHRGRDMPPPVLMGDASLLRALATDVPDGAKELIAKHWPGPLTLICRIQPSLRMDLGETEGTIALRVPDHPLAREVLRRTGPMAVSSANLSGRPAALTCDDAIEQLGDSVAVYLDAGALTESGGSSSTIVDFTQRDGGEVLRHGALSLAVLRETLPDVIDLTETGPSGVRKPAGAHVLTEAPDSDEPDSDDPDSDESVLFDEGVPWHSDESTHDEPNRSTEADQPAPPGTEPRNTGS